MLKEQSKNQTLNPEEEEKEIMDAFDKMTVVIANLNLKPGDSKVIECPLCGRKISY